MVGLGETFDAARVTSDLVRLAGAFLLALPIGWNREKELHTAGIRTFPTVSIACCGLVVVAQNIPNLGPDGFSRILQGLVAGIGFVGGGAIFKGQGGVTSAATAASILNIGIVGAAVGLGAYHVAIALTVMNYLTLRFFAPLKRELDKDHE